MTKRFNGYDGAGTDTAFDAQTAGVSTTSTSPSPFSGSLCGVVTAAAGTPGYYKWNLDTLGPWQFRRMIYLSTQANTDLDLVKLINSPGGTAATSLIIRANAAGFLRMVSSGGAFPWTSTSVIPSAGWYRLEGYGDAVTGTARVALFNPTSATPITNLDSGALTGVAEGASGLTSVQLGKSSNGTGYTGTIAMDSEEFYTGTDATSAFLGPYVSLSGVVTPSDHTVGTTQTLTLTATGFTPTSYSGTWDGVAWGPQVSNVVTHTDASGKAGQTINWTATATA